MTLRGRIFLLSASLLVIVLAFAGLLVRTTVGELLARDVRDRLAADLEVGSELLRQWEGVPPQEMALRLADVLGYRVTLITPAGVIVGESAIPTMDVEALEDHFDRPEVQAALRGETALVERTSASLGTRSLVAATMAEVGEQEVVLRLSRPADPLAAPLRRTLWLLLGTGLGGVFFAWVVGGVLASTHRRSVAELTASVRRMSDGDFRERPRRSTSSPDLGELAASLGTLSDELRGRLSELERDRKELGALVDSIAEGVVELTPDARVLRMNRAAAELLDVSTPAEFAPIGTLIRNPELRDHMVASVVGPLPPKEVRLGERYLLVSTRTMEGGGAVLTFLDITGIRLIEQVRRDFVANASHELKTPLTAMRGFAETLLEDDPPEPHRTEFLRSIRSNTLRLQNLVDDLLDLSRLESGGWTAGEEEILVADAAREAWDELPQGDDASRVRFQVEGDGLAVADAQALHQIFRNLFDNALRYTESGGRIGVRITRVGPRLRVSVSDTGTGIPSSTLGRIFERFYRADAGRDRAAGGTGLGLAIVRHLVQSMGGEVWAESELGKGTTVHFTLPRVES